MYDLLCELISSKQLLPIFLIYPGFRWQGEGDNTCSDHRELQIVNRNDDTCSDHRELQSVNRNDVRSYTGTGKTSILKINDIENSLKLLFFIMYLFIYLFIISFWIDKVCLSIFYFNFFFKFAIKFIFVGMYGIWSTWYTCSDDRALQVSVTMTTIEHVYSLDTLVTFRVQ